MFTYEEIIAMLCAPLAALTVHTSTTEVVDDAIRSTTPPPPVEDDDTDTEVEKCEKKPFKLRRCSRLSLRKH